MFQGMARGKVGDVVFSRLNGEQISRVRNRHPKNPRTNAQLYQRAIMATIMQAYSAGREIFDHSFQGKAVGMDNQREFISRNMSILRNLVKVDLESGNTRAQSIARVVAPKSSTPVPFNGMLVSKGELNNNVVTIDAAGDNWTIPNAPLAVGQSAAAWFASYGVSDGDIFTFVVFRNTDTVVYQNDNITDVNYDKQYGCEFGWLRLIAKTTLSGNITSTTTLADLFDFEADGVVLSPAKISALTLSSWDEQPVQNLFISTGDDAVGAIAVIRSRRDIDVRSTAYLQNLNGSNNKQYGIATPDILTVWTNAVDSLGGSELILEGGDGGF